MNCFGGGGEDSPLYPPVDETLVLGMELVVGPDHLNSFGKEATKSMA